MEFLPIAFLHLLHRHTQYPDISVPPCLFFYFITQFKNWIGFVNSSTLSTSRGVGRGTGAFIYLPPFSENSPIFCSFPFAKIQPVFLPEQTGRMEHRTPFSPSATPTGITHYTLQAKSCAKGDTPLETPDNKTGGMLPSPGAYRRLLSAARFTVCV